ncbi:MAG TPA: DUF58 domain-containing protein [Phycisphaerales bacterium]|nr:DUF58 domain-containing protein [Phycisphaerales bacterium]
MLPSTKSERPRTLDELLGPELAGRLDRLDVLSRKMLAGKLPGERRSKRRGRSVEFDDFRNYVPGDDLRHIDWNILARLDKFFIKLFREEEDLALHLILDASASMDTGNPNKLVYAHQLAMALGYVGLVNQNRVSMATFGGPDPDSPTGATRTRLHQLAPLRGRTGVQRLANFLLDNLAATTRRSLGSGPDPDALFAEAMRTAALGRAGRGVMIVISDFLHPGSSSAGLQYLGAATMDGAFDTYALQVLAPAEIDPAKDQDRGLVGDLRLTDIETGGAAEVTVTPASVARYKQALQKHNQALRNDCLSRGIAYFLVPTDTPVDQLILGSLRKGGLLR